ncbi:SnoaL-like domain-containing protein [Pustulibacterium marinum]|uniref:SnoaL-like domain-containing protein n=1 Tax=Pustulibacterium marinum TaxID=1224947 RepID=A0A1I7EZW4_9FLAO|nr:nuclear transport factor 2 family protein [Pustulibacterium marinum]SFU29483.1 SnoaL-like domain-containing protein [Pustulibacterium marinum]
MKIITTFIFLFVSFLNAQTNEQQVTLLLDNWHKAAAEANFVNYFEKMTEDAVFIGTDANENWNKKEFMAYAKPHFDKGKAWSFTSLEKNIYFNKEKTIAWFDELLDTQMKICRGSGVAVKQDGVWKIQHYVLSMTIPNNNISEIIQIKSEEEDKILQELKQN